MKSREAGGARGRWGEVFLGGLAVLGVPMVLSGMRSWGSQGSPVTVGAVAGLLGALLGGRLARRTRGSPALSEAEAGSEEEALGEGQGERVKPRPGPGDAPEPRRGPSGRERHWHWGDTVAHSS